MTRRVRKTMPGVVLIPDLASTINALRELARAPGAAAAARDADRRCGRVPGAPPAPIGDVARPRMLRAGAGRCVVQCAADGRTRGPIAMLYPELFKAFEAVRWNLEADVPWARSMPRGCPTSRRARSR